MYYTHTHIEKNKYINIKKLKINFTREKDSEYSSQDLHDYVTTSFYCYVSFLFR